MKGVIYMINIKDVETFDEQTLKNLPKEFLEEMMNNKDPEEKKGEEK